MMTFLEQLMGTEHKSKLVNLVMCQTVLLQKDDSLQKLHQPRVLLLTTCAIFMKSLRTVPLNVLPLNTESQLLLGNFMLKLGSSSKLQMLEETGMFLLQISLHQLVQGNLDVPSVSTSSIVVDGVNLGAIFTLIYSVGVSRPWPLLSYIRHDDRGHSNLSLDGDIGDHLIVPSRQERVLNFISLPVSVECVSDDGRRSGICLNVYECKIQQGVSQGKCALGFGVCCVFSATCDSGAINNLTYFVNPHFPGLSSESRLCHFTVTKLAPQISQLRLDFIHFSIAQPNRKTGICENDVMIIENEKTSEFKLCGLNNGQHIYYDVEDVKEPIKIVMNLTKESFDRIWEIKITQIEFKNKAPTGCLQYFTEPTGTIQTMNFAENGRHLANQDYTICVRQEEGACSIVYEPCDENSFKIGPPVMGQDMVEGSGGQEGEEEAEAMVHPDQCSDKVLMPCDSEEFITADEKIPGICDLLHCGSSFCPQGESPCRIESSTTPFNIRVQFGPAIEGESPDDNLGMCLKFEQLSCY